MKKRKRNQDFLSGQDVLEIKIRDGGRNVYYRAKSPVHNKKRIREIIRDLNSYGVDVREIMRIELEEEIWFK